ncbi:hypothetical protein BASA81_012919 [Batrachochytrium salamandrivorans]|nr:hypothetical protein BASA81_012919 [Batrachochytrium salamandrivorans]
MKSLFVLLVSQAVLSKSLAGKLRTFLYLQPDGQVFGTGDNAYGMLGTGEAGGKAQYPTPMLYVANASDISAGDWHSCLVEQSENAAVKCTGYNANGQLGSGVDVESSQVLVPVVGLPSPVSQVFCGEYNCFALVQSTGAAWAWGRDSHGQLGVRGVGDETPSSSSTPRPVLAAAGSSLERVQQAAAGYLHSCLLTESGQVACMGFGAYGQLGSGNLDSSSFPVPIASSLLGDQFVSVACGDYHTCAVTAQGQAACWGRDYYGQLGGNSAGDSTVPAPVLGLGLGSAESVWTGYANTFVLLRNGSVAAFGMDNYGTLGDGDTQPKPAPVMFANETVNVREVRGGAFTTCVLLASGQVSCLGDNFYSQFGVGPGLASSYSLVGWGKSDAPTGHPTDRRPSSSPSASPSFSPSSSPTSSPVHQ